MPKVKSDWRTKPADDVERLMAQATPEQVTAVQARLKSLVTQANWEVGCTAPKFAHAIDQMHETPIYFRDVAPEFRIPVIQALRQVMATAIDEWGAGASPSP